MLTASCSDDGLMNYSFDQPDGDAAWQGTRGHVRSNHDMLTDTDAALNLLKKAIESEAANSRILGRTSSDSPTPRQAGRDAKTAKGYTSHSGCGANTAESRANHGFSGKEGCLRLMQLRNRTWWGPHWTERTPATEGNMHGDD
ncbi:MAG TPA: hypothetical protein DEF45_17710 [Rhodopirellula sp.]|nr:hypothetical protein [Rhodopirellula sp.]